MNAIAVLSASMLAGLSTFAASPSDSARPASPAPVAFVVVTYDADECKCKATTGAAHMQNDTTIECAGGTAGSLFITTPMKSDGPCDTEAVPADETEGGDDETQITRCKTKEGSVCKATIVATLLWPTPAPPPPPPAAPTPHCCASAAMTGPTIGTDANPCQQAPHGSSISQSWTLSSECKTGAGSTSAIGSKAFSVYCGTPCNQLGGATPTAKFNPKLTCAPCAKT